MAINAVFDVLSKLGPGFELLEQENFRFQDRIQIDLSQEIENEEIYAGWGLGYEIESGNSGVTIYADYGGGKEPTNELFTGENSRAGATGEVENGLFYRLLATVPAGLSGTMQILIHRVPASLRGTDREANRSAAAGGSSGGASFDEIVVDAPALVASGDFPWTSSLIARPAGAAGAIVNFNVTAQVVGAFPSIDFEFYDADDARPLSDIAGYFHRDLAWNPLGAVPSGPPYKQSWMFRPGTSGGGAAADIAVWVFPGTPLPPRSKLYITNPVDLTSLTFGVSVVPLA